MEWSARYRVSVEPEAHSTFRVLVKTRAGRTVLAGRGKWQRGGEVRFEVAAADVPGAVPISVVGRFDGKKLVFDSARSGVRRLPSRTPSREVPSRR